MLRLTLAGPDTLVTSPLCARCPTGPAGCCAAPPAVAWADLGRIVERGGGEWLLAEIESGRLRPCSRGLAIERVSGPHGVACTYLGETGCVLPPERRSMTCNEYLCEDAFLEAERAGDPAAKAARKAHEELESALSAWDEAVAAEVNGEGAAAVPADPARATGVVYNAALLERLRAAFVRAARKTSTAIAMTSALLTAVLLVFMCGCAGLPSNVPRGGAFDARHLEGGWTVVATNFPMWLEGNKSDPNFIYRIRPGTSPVELDDVVAYTQSGRRDTIEGTDTQDPSAPAHFTWRGNGLLAAFASDWIVLAEGPDQRWMILYFTKTLATPEGVDVISKKAPLPEEDRVEVEKALSSNPFLKQKSAGIVWLRGAVSK